MNLTVNQLPKNWNPGNTKAINKWFDKICKPTYLKNDVSDFHTIKKIPTFTTYNK